MDWKGISVKLVETGLPVLGKAVGQLIGSNVPLVGAFIDTANIGQNMGAQAAKMIADALGVEPSPDAINTAIEAGNTTEVIANLQKVEAEALAKWPALAEIAKAEEATAQVQITTTSDLMKQEILNTEKIEEGGWRTLATVMNALWRPFFAFELLLECMIFSLGGAIFLFVALIKNEYADIDAVLKLMPIITVLALPYMAARFGLVGYHMNLRTREKENINDAVTNNTKPVSMDEIKMLLKASGVKVKG